ncbi:MAG: NAD(P)-dependent oxidoreductase [Armatimonadota bacterium]|nr:MAG: NAD(P)-dependent oxidoreductase [Armatimonadota bacterium]
MKVCVIGGSGHIGQNLVRMLVREGCEVIVVSRGQTPIPSGGVWDKVRAVTCDYRRGDEEWAKCVRDIGAEVMIDIPGTDVPGTYAAVRGLCAHFIACGSVWMFGEPQVVPTPEETQTPCPFEGYAVRYRELLDTRERARGEGVAFTAIMPPNICGPGKIPLEGRGGRSIEVHQSHQRGEPVPLPEPGQTLIGPCDAEDVAQGFFLAAQQREAAAGEIFNVGSRYALTALRLIETYGEIYGVEIPIEWHSWEEYSTDILPDLGSNFHFKAHMCPDLSKITSRLGYAPRHTPEETLARAVGWMRDTGLL